MTAPVNTERVLVVDDEPDIVALVAYHLAKSGYRVSTASNGQDALTLARQERPSLVVLDLMLPGLSGFDVLEQLRSDDSTRDVAVLMLTARREEPDRIRGLSLGADDYLTKPFSPQELVLRVSAILRRVGASAHTATDVLAIGPIRIDRAAHRVSVDATEDRADADGVQAAVDARRAPRPRTGARPSARNRVGGRARYPDPHGRYAYSATPHEAGTGWRSDRDRARIRLPAARRARTGRITRTRACAAGGAPFRAGYVPRLSEVAVRRAAA